MGLFRCCRSNAAVNENAHSKLSAHAGNTSSQGDNYDEDIQAVRWMRERSLERSLEKELRSMSDDERRLLTMQSEDEFCSSKREAGMNEAQTLSFVGKDAFGKKLRSNAEIIEDLFDESQRSQTEIETLEGEGHEKLRILSKKDVASIELEDRQRHNLEKRNRRESKPSKEQDLSLSKKQRSNQVSPSKVAPVIKAASKVLMESKDRNATRDLEYASSEIFQPDAYLQLKGNIDPVARDRYLVAVQLLHRRIIQKQDSLSAAEKAFLKDLLQPKEDDESTINERILEIESTVERLDSTERVGGDHLSIECARLSSSSSKENLKSSLYVDLYSVRPTPSEDGVEAALGYQSSQSSKKRPNVALTHTDESIDAPPSLTTEEEGNYDDLRDSPFPVLGASQIQNRLLKVRLMEALRGFLPYSVSEQNFWLKFSMERDGCSLKTLLGKMRGSHSCLIVIQAEGDKNHIFGAFTSTQWSRHERWFGNGQSFLFKSKDTLEVYPFTGADDMVQYCSSQMIAVGGGDWMVSSPFGNEEAKGIGLLLDGDLQGGESYSCATFCNPCLSHNNEFSILNIEVWTLTPCMTEDEAEKLHQRKQLVEANRREATN